MGRAVREEKGRRNKIREEKGRRKKIKVCETVEQSQNACVLLKRWMRSHRGRWEMKNCTLWREADFEVKSVKNWRPRTTFGCWDLENVHTTTATTPTSLCYTTPDYNYTTPHYKQCTIMLNYTTLRYATLHYTCIYTYNYNYNDTTTTTARHYTTLPYTRLHCTTNATTTTTTTRTRTNYTTLLAQ